MQRDMSYITKLRNGYEVKICRFGVRKQFLKTVYGDSLALPVALMYRDGLYAQYGIGPLHIDKPNPYFHSRNGKGTLSGVSLSLEIAHAYFVAKIHDGEKWTRKRFSIQKLGYVNAFRAAVMARLENCDLGIDAEAVELHRPTLDEFVVLCSMAEDVPSPISKAG
jgi:hypothetical protein